MKQLYLASFSLMLSLLSIGQSQVTEFGEFTLNDINLKECSFDKTAPAVVIFDKALSSYNDEYNLVTERRIRMKILKEQGIRKADIQIPFYSNDDFETITAIKAITYTNDADNRPVITELKQKDIYTKKINKYYSLISFALPNVKAGTLIEYSYTSIMKHYGGLTEWIFQKDIPVMLSSYYVAIVPNAEFAYTVYKSKTIPIKVTPFQSSGGMLYEMQNIPGLREEAYMSASKDYLQRVVFQLRGIQGKYGGERKINVTWKDVARELSNDKDFGGQTEKPVSYKSEITALTKDTSEYARMLAVFNYIRSNVSWDNIDSRYSIDGVKNTWQKKQGNSGDINLLLINILKGEHIAAYPLLVSERENGRVDTAYPYLDQFNKVVAYVELKDRTYILDATNSKSHPDIIPFELLNTMAFLVDKKKYQLMPVYDATKTNKKVINIAAVLNETGLLKAKATVMNYDYGKLQTLYSYHTDKKQFSENILTPEGSIKIDSFDVEEDDKIESPFRQNINFNYQLNRSSGYYLLNYNLLSGLYKNPFVSDLRFTDIDYGCRYVYQQMLNVSIPPSMKIESLPKNIKIAVPGNAAIFTREINKSDDNNFTLSFAVNINQTLIAADDYELIKSFYSKMFESLNESIVLKQK